MFTINLRLAVDEGEEEEEGDEAALRTSVSSVIMSISSDSQWLAASNSDHIHIFNLDGLHVCPSRLSFLRHTHSTTVFSRGSRPTTPCSGSSPTRHRLLSAV
jgi:hypothetical protein